MKMSAGNSSDENIPVSGPDRTGSHPARASASDANVESDAAIVGDGRLPSSAMRSYALLTPDLKELYFKFYKATYGKTKLDLKTKEYIAIAAALALGCKGCLEGHLKKAKKEGASAEEISEVIAVTLGVAAAAIVDRSDIANFHLGGLFEKPE
ncbi:MAG: carboxymuconolactone decarboxylase family protein [Planctomycetota bacterium]